MHPGRSLAFISATKLAGTSNRRHITHVAGLMAPGVLWAGARPTTPRRSPVRGLGDFDRHVPQLIIGRANDAHTLNRLLGGRLMRTPSNNDNESNHYHLAHGDSLTTAGSGGRSALWFAARLAMRLCFYCQKRPAGGSQIRRPPSAISCSKRSRDRPTAVCQCHKRTLVAPCR
jgi:hypothetical protein